MASPMFEERTVLASEDVRESVICMNFDTKYFVCIFGLFVMQF